MRQIDDGEGLVVRGFQHDRRCDTHLPRFFPARRAQTPFVAGFEPRKLKFRSRRDQVIAAIETVLQEFASDAHAHGVQAMIHWSGIAAAIPKETGWIVAARGQCVAENIPGSGGLGHVAGMGSGLLAADFNTPQ